MHTHSRRQSSASAAPEEWIWVNEYGSASWQPGHLLSNLAIFHTSDWSPVTDSPPQWTCCIGKQRAVLYFFSLKASDNTHTHQISHDAYTSCIAFHCLDGDRDWKCNAWGRKIIKKKNEESGSLQDRSVLHRVFPNFTQKVRRRDHMYPNSSRMLK